MAVRDFVPLVEVVGFHLDFRSRCPIIPDPEQASRTYGERRRCFCGCKISIYNSGCLCSSCRQFLNDFNFMIGESSTIRYFHLLEFIKTHDKEMFREWQETVREIRQEQRQIDRGKVAVPA